MSLEELVDAFINLEKERVLKIVNDLLRSGREPAEIIEVCRNATTIIGEKFEKEEYFLSELVFAGEIFSDVMEMVLPALKGEVKSLGKIVLGTVKEDIHDIGKNIFKAFAEAAGFRVIDLGVDVPPERFVEAVRVYNPDIVGMSGLLTVSHESMKKTVEALKESGLRCRVKVIIGGGRVNDSIREYIGADEWADDAMLGVKKCKRLLGIEG